MAENEIAKHIESAYKALNNHETTWVHKLREVLIEIGIIVFAVSLSIWFYNWSDSLHERKEEKEYLTGFKQDILADLDDAMDDRKAYTWRLRSIKYFQRV